MDDCKLTDLAFNITSGHGKNDNVRDNFSQIFNRSIWGIEDVCSFTSYAKGTVYNLVSRGEIPYHKRGGGRRLVFVPSEVIEWFKGEL